MKNDSFQLYQRAFLLGYFLYIKNTLVMFDTTFVIFLLISGFCDIRVNYLDQIIFLFFQS